jgi:N-formylglutamate amidohydrolase
VRTRIDRFWRPYHAALDAAVDERHRAFGGVWHINCHSMPAIGDALSDDPGRERADFVLGDRDGTACDTALTDLVATTVRGLGYSVAINDPYKGVELVRKHGRPGENRHSLQIELKRTLYMDERTLVPHDGYPRLQRDLARLAEVLAGFVRARLRAG